MPRISNTLTDLTVNSLLRGLLSGYLPRFIQESCAIESLFSEDIAALEPIYLRFLNKKHLTLRDVCAFVSKTSTGELRDTPEVNNVIVGNFRPIPSGPEVPKRLKRLLRVINIGGDPYLAHIEYETLHPFSDGNGRSGRAIWLWQMIHQQSWTMNYSFLQKWYYETLAHSEVRK